jgi:hypothetical protein
VPPTPRFVAADRARSGYDAGLRAYVEQLRRTHPALDLQTLTFQPYDLDDFTDDHHLSRKGRRRLSREFADWLDNRLKAAEPR